MCEKALREGLGHSDVKGSLKKYVDSLYFKNKASNNIKIFAEKVFIFEDETLITILPLPNRFKKVVNK